MTFSIYTISLTGNRTFRAYCETLAAARTRARRIADAEGRDRQSAIATVEVIADGAQRFRIAVR